MKGHMQDGKFHPHTEYKKGTRKSRDQSTKTKGIKVERKARDSLHCPYCKTDLTHHYSTISNKCPSCRKDLSHVELIHGERKARKQEIDFRKADTKTALEFIRDHPNTTRDHLQESTDIGAGEDYKFEDADLEIQAILDTLEKEGKIFTDNPDAEFVKYRIKVGRETSTNPRRDDYLKSEYWIENSYINHTIIGLEGTQDIDGDPMVKGHIQDAINSLKKAKKFQHEENERMNG